MKVWSILKALEALENGTAALYDSLRLHHARDREAAAMFLRLRDDELAHRDIVRYGQRVLSGTPESSVDLPEFDRCGLEVTMQLVNEAILRAGWLSLEDALDRCLALEMAAIQQHYGNVVGRAHPALGAMVRRLGRGDRDHLALLRSFCDRRELPVRGGEG